MKRKTQHTLWMVAKSCTTLGAWNLIRDGISHLSTGAGFLQTISGWWHLENHLVGIVGLHSRPPCDASCDRLVVMMVIKTWEIPVDDLNKGWWHIIFPDQRPLRVLYVFHAVKDIVFIARIVFAIKCWSVWPSWVEETRPFLRRWLPPFCIAEFTSVSLIFLIL